MDNSIIPLPAPIEAVLIDDVNGVEIQEEVPVLLLALRDVDPPREWLVTFVSTPAYANHNAETMYVLTNKVRIKGGR